MKRPDVVPVPYMRQPHNRGGGGMPKVKARNLLLAMVLAGKGEFNSTERLDEEMKIIRLIHKVDRYLGGRKGKYDLNPEG